LFECATFFKKMLQFAQEVLGLPSTNRPYLSKPKPSMAAADDLSVRTTFFFGGFFLVFS
jgi:hypothetical protein